MEQGILYSEYDYFTLEGVAPFGSYLMPLDRRDAEWVDMRDARRYHRERYFQTHEKPPREGVEDYATGTGAGGIDKHCQFIEGQMTCEQQAITDTLTFDQWFAGMTRSTRQRVDMRTDPTALTALNGSVFKGIQVDPDWGEVYVFERRVPIGMSDRYQGQEGIEIQLIDAKMMRRIEDRRIVMDSGKEVLHMRYRLKTWKVLAPAEVPSDLFDLERVPNGKFTP